MLKKIAILILMATLLALSACGETVLEEADAATTMTTTTEPETVIQRINPPTEIPLLPQTGTQLDDFIPEGWHLMDSISLDFNGDGREDHVGVLAHISVRWPLDWPNLPEEEIAYTRILFAVKGTSDGYQLSFQDENLIRRRGEGGPFGDPYSGLSVEGSTFTSSAFGGSSWRWSDEHTFQYMNGTWYLVKRHQQGFHGPQISDRLDDYLAGVGVHWSIDADIVLEWRWNLEGEDSEMDMDELYRHKTEETITLGPPPTLEAFSREFTQEMHREG